jgi:hypothetical protein
MVTNAMLREAAGVAEGALLQALENKTFEPHQFSEQFERKMNKLVRRAKRPIQYNVMRSAAAILLVAAILFGMVFAISPEVRADVINWIKSTFFEYSQYSGEGEIDNTEYEYYFPTIPEGYSELSAIDSKDGKIYLYVHKEGHMLQFSYAKGNRAHNLFVKTDLHSYIEAQVNGNLADVYITESTEETNAIVWRDSKTDTLLCITAKADKDLLIALAESVTKTQK